jgi:DNA-directed RNA polymerase specialized sigma24 family protein
MRNMLQIVAQDHQRWIDMVNKFGGYSVAEDIVQEAYLRLHKYGKPEKIIKNGKANQPFMFIVLRNTYMNHCNEQNRIHHVELSQTAELKHTNNVDWKKAQNKLDKKIEAITDTWHWYDKMLFNYYKDSGKSLREISFETGISVTSLWNTIKNCRERLKEELHEDYQDLINEDYELL